MFSFLFQSSEDSYGSAVVGDVTYDFVQMHMHTLSEHTADEEYSAVELHFVHHNANLDKYAVIGLMCDVSDSGANAKFFETLQSTAESAQSVDFSSLLSTVDTQKYCFFFFCFFFQRVILLYFVKIHIFNVGNYF